MHTTRMFPPALAGVLVTLAVAAPAAHAGPNEDYTGVKRHWFDNGQRILPCRFNDEQLQNTLNVSQTVPDDNYTSFRNAVAAELQRVRSGGCVRVGGQATVPRDAQMTLRVSPKRVRGGKRVRITLTVTVPTSGGTRPVEGATLTLAGRTARSDTRGRARFVIRFKSAATHQATATMPGLRAGTAKLQVLRPRAKK